MKSTFISLVLVFALSGCATPEFVGRAVKAYCSATTPLERAALRERMNAEVSPHAVMIQCEEADNGSGV